MRKRSKGAVIRDFVAATYLKIIALVIVEIMLLRVMGPWFIDVHDDLLGWLGVACFVLGPLIGLYYLWWLYYDYQKLRADEAALDGTPSETEREQP